MNIIRVLALVGGFALWCIAAFPVLNEDNTSRNFSLPSFSSPPSPSGDLYLLFRSGRAIYPNQSYGDVETLPSATPTSSSLSSSIKATSSIPTTFPNAAVPTAVSPTSTNATLSLSRSPTSTLPLASSATSPNHPISTSTIPTSTLTLDENEAAFRSAGLDVIGRLSNISTFYSRLPPWAQSIFLVESVRLSIEDGPKKGDGYFRLSVPRWGKRKWIRDEPFVMDFAEPRPCFTAKSTAKEREFAFPFTDFKSMSIVIIGPCIPKRTWGYHVNGNNDQADEILTPEYKEFSAILRANNYSSDSLEPLEITLPMAFLFLERTYYFTLGRPTRLFKRFISGDCDANTPQECPMPIFNFDSLLTDLKLTRRTDEWTKFNHSSCDNGTQWKVIVRKYTYFPEPVFFALACSALFAVPILIFCACKLRTVFVRIGHLLRQGCCGAFMFVFLFVAVPLRWLLHCVGTACLRLADPMPSSRRRTGTSKDVEKDAKKGETKETIVYSSDNEDDSNDKLSRIPKRSRNLLLN